MAGKMQRAWMLVQVDYTGKVFFDLEDPRVVTGEETRPLELEELSGELTRDQDKAIEQMLDDMFLFGGGLNSLEGEFKASVLGFTKALPRNRVY